MILNLQRGVAKASSRDGEEPGARIHLNTAVAHPDLAHVGWQIPSTPDLQSAPARRNFAVRVGEALNDASRPRLRFAVVIKGVIEIKTHKRIGFVEDEANTGPPLGM